MSTCYNHEDTVARCMDSILMQKVDFDYEVLVCDDCSGDNSQEIFLRYKDKFKNIKFLFKQKTTMAIKGKWWQIFDQQWCISASQRAISCFVRK